MHQFGDGESARLEMSTMWKALRRKGMANETQLQNKLDQYANMPVMISRLSQSQESKENDETKMQGMVDKLEKEIDEFLAVLLQIDRDMSSLLEESPAVEEYQAHTYERFRAVVQTCNSEYKRTKRTVRQALNRLQLLSTDKKSDDAPSPFGDDGVSTLMSEKASIESSISIIDDTLELAYSTNDSLLSQRNVFEGTEEKTRQIDGAFPRLNQVIKSIGDHKRRDTIVLSLVIAGCFMFLFLYWSYKPE